MSRNSPYPTIPPPRSVSAGAIIAGKSEPLAKTIAPITAPAIVALIRKRLSKVVQGLGAELRDDSAGGNAGAQDCVRWAVTIAFAPVTSSH